MNEKKPLMIDLYRAGANVVCDFVKIVFRLKKKKKKNTSKFISESQNARPRYAVSYRVVRFEFRFLSFRHTLSLTLYDFGYRITSEEVT